MDGSECRCVQVRSLDASRSSLEPFHCGNCLAYKSLYYRHDTAMYWSHAGKHFGISAAGKWWGSVSPEMMAEFFKDNMKEYERIVREDFVSEEFGDRRQEIVFIGVGLKQEDITSTLDKCLVGPVQGMERYRQELDNYKNTFFSSGARGPGLFDVGVVDHMDME